MKNQTHIPFNVSLTKTQRARVKELVSKNRNVNRACLFAGMNDRTYHKALRGTMIKNYQRDRLMEFCDMIEGKKQVA